MPRDGFDAKGRCVMRAWRSWRQAAFILSITTSLVATLCAQAVGAHMKSGLKWMDLKEYNKARQEFYLSSLIDEPGDAIEARYQVAMSYKLEGNLVQAIEACVDVCAISPKDARTRDLLSDIVTLTKNGLAAGDASSLTVLTRLLDRGLISPEPILKENVLPLLRSPDERVDAACFRLLKQQGMDVEGLAMLARDTNTIQRQKALRIVSEEADPRYQPVLKILMTDEQGRIKETAAVLLVERYDDGAAKAVVAQIYHAYLQDLIATARTKKRGLEFSGIDAETPTRLVQVSGIAWKLGDPSLACELVELVCDGTAYGFLADNLLASVERMGKPTLPYLKEVLTREPELRRSMEQKGLSDADSQINWRFEKVRAMVGSLER